MFGLQKGAIFKQFAIIIVANFTVLQFGLSIAWMSPVLVKISDKNQTILHEPITDQEASWLVSISILTGLLVMPFAGYLANNLGRKRTIVIMAIPRVLASILLFFTKQTWMLLLVRSLAGLSDLVHVSVTSTYSSEIASKEIRGALGTVSQIQSSFGAMLMLTVGPFVSFQSLNTIYCCLVIGTTLPILFIPETPYFLFSKGQTDKSIKVLTFLRGSETLARKEIQEYSTADQTKIVIKELFTDSVVLKTIGKVIILGICGQIVGYNSIYFYLQTIFNSTKVNVSSEVSSFIIGCIQVVACFCTIFLTDRLGRKPILTISLAGLFLGMVGLGTFFQLTEDGREITGFLNYLPLISIAMVMFFFNAGLGSTLWTLVAELFDGKFRAIGMSIAVFTASFFAFFLMIYFPYITLTIGPATTYFLFGGGCVFTGLFIAFFINETKGKPFSQIQMELGRCVDDVNNLEKLQR